MYPYSTEIPPGVLSGTESEGNAPHQAPHTGRNSQHEVREGEYTNTTGPGVPSKEIERYSIDGALLDAREAAEVLKRRSTQT